MSTETPKHQYQEDIEHPAVDCCRLSTCGLLVKVLGLMIQVETGHSRAEGLELGWSTESHSQRLPDVL